MLPYVRALWPGRRMREVPHDTSARVRRQRGPVPSLGTGDTVLSEHLEQREFVSWFRKTHPGVRIFAIPNGGYRSIAAASRLKAEGVSAGVPDLFVPAWSVWIEMKRAKGGALSEKQKDWRNYLISIGQTVIVAHGKEKAISAILALREGQSVQ